MKKYFFLIGFLMAGMLQNRLQAQYYHKDIIGNRQALKEKNLLQDLKIKKVIVHSFEGDRSESEGFFCEKKITKNYRLVETYTKSYISGRSILTASYNENGLLLQSTDSSDMAVSVSQYEYDLNGNILRIISRSHSFDDDFATRLIEIHQYKYDNKSRPVQMLRIRNGKDSALIDFVQDERGNITDEIEPGINGQHFYYYYDDKNRLTDIVKYNAVKGALKPDFIFEYNRQNQLVKMVAIEEGMSGDYNTWQYVYGDEGQRIIEKCFSKENILLGYFEYEYK